VRDVLIVAPRQSARAVTEKLGGAFERIEALPPAMLFHANSPVMPVPLYLGHGLRAFPAQDAPEDSLTSAQQKPRPLVQERASTQALKRSD
jgi:hypothetical protein